MIRITEEEIKNSWLEGYKEQDLTSDDYDLDYLRDNLYFEDMFALRTVTKAQLKRVVEWGDEDCEEHPYTSRSKGEAYNRKRHRCPQCRQVLLDEVKE